MNFVSIGITRSRPRDGVGPVNEGSIVPVMRPRTGRRGTDAKLVALLCEALDDLAGSHCSFWACEGPNKPRHMATCVKCWAMRNIATVKASLEARP